MRRANRQFLIRVFEVLGPERVRQGLAAMGHEWDRCFLAGACGELPEGAPPIPTRTLSAGPFLGAWLGMAPGWVYEVARLWDRDEQGFRDTARDWLRSQVPAPTEVTT
jgi:hypothetical protein